MINKFKQFFYAVLALLIRGFIWLIMKTCRITVHGLDEFKNGISQNKCVVMLWHNRLVLAPYILYQHGMNRLFAGAVSKSKDTLLLRSIIQSYKNGRMILVPHNRRYAALRQIIESIKNDDMIPVITPDGPRGPSYKLKQGAAVTAIETEALMIPLNWEASRFWKLNTWDQLRIPKPFAKIEIVFGSPLRFSRDYALETVQNHLERALTND